MMISFILNKVKNYIVFKARIPDRINIRIIKNQIIFCNTFEVFFGLPSSEEPKFDPLLSVSGKLIKIANMLNVLRIFRIIFNVDIIIKDIFILNFLIPINKSKKVILSKGLNFIFKILVVF